MTRFIMTAGRAEAGRGRNQDLTGVVCRRILVLCAAVCLSECVGRRGDSATAVLLRGTRVSACLCERGRETGRYSVATLWTR